MVLGFERRQHVLGRRLPQAPLQAGQYANWTTYRTQRLRRTQDYGQLAYSKASGPTRTNTGASQDYIHSMDAQVKY